MDEVYIIATNPPAPLWSEKYRPQKFDALVGRGDLVAKLQKFAVTREFPHLIFAGPPGGGKMTLARIFAREVLQQDFDFNFQELFAGDRLSEEETKEAKRASYISTARLGSSAGSTFIYQKFVQVRVKPFVEVRAIGAARFKILVIKDFEQLENQQQGFRRLMESFSQNCRFILLSSKLSNIIEPILSRCQVLFIPRLDYKDFFKVLKSVGDQEGIKFGIPVTQALYRALNGQVGRALDILQVASKQSPTITEDSVYGVFKEFAPSQVRTVLQLALRGDAKRMRETLRALVKNQVLSMRDIFQEIFTEISMQPLPRFAKVEVLSLLSDLDSQAIYHRVEETQVCNVLMQLFKYSQGREKV